MAEKWTKTSALPSSGVMKPKPFSPLNHFTVPCAMFLSPHTVDHHGAPPEGAPGRGQNPNSGSCPATRAGPGRPRAPGRREPAERAGTSRAEGTATATAATLARTGHRESVQGPLGRLHDVGEEHRAGHRTDAARHGRDPRRHLPNRPVDVTDEPRPSRRLV